MLGVVGRSVRWSQACLESSSCYSNSHLLPAWSSTGSACCQRTAAPQRSLPGTPDYPWHHRARNWPGPAGAEARAAGIRLYRPGIYRCFSGCDRLADGRGAVDSVLRPTVKIELLMTPSNAGAIPQFSREATRIAITLITCVSCYEVLKSLLFHRQ